MSDKRKLLVIEWVDSHATNGWRPLDDIACEPLHCRSVGWLVGETDQMVVLVASISGEKNGDITLFGCGEIAIPKSAITNRMEATCARAAKRSRR